jgi:hypothetical protein
MTGTDARLGRLETMAAARADRRPAILVLWQVDRGAGGQQYEDRATGKTYSAGDPELATLAQNLLFVDYDRGNHDAQP